MNARVVTLELLRQWETGQFYADDLLEEVLMGLAKTGATGDDRALTMELFYGVLRNQTFLDWVIETLAPAAPRRATRTLLRLGAYQLLFLDRVSSYAAVSEMTNLAKRKCSAEEVEFVHAVLRRIASDKVPLRVAINQLKVEKPAVYYSHPEWLWDRWQTRWGQEPAEELCAWDNTPPPVVLRVNQLKTNTEDFLSALRLADVLFQLHPKSDSCVVVHSIAPELVPGFFEGHFYVQDPATLIAVDALDPQPGETILDACAAPGGKCGYIAQKMRNRGKVVACDTSSKRLKWLEQNCKRLGATLGEPMQWDFADEPPKLPKARRPARAKAAVAVASQAADPDPQPPPSRPRASGLGIFPIFDRVLVDAPCSNTGVIRRRVDVRWRLQPKDLESHASKQLQLLNSTSPLVKEGGILVYSTCSLEPEENENVVETFLKSAPQFQLAETRSTFPPRDEMDGAFVAKLSRTG